MYVVVVGAGEVGSSIAANLSDSHEVAVVDIDPGRADTLTYEFDVLAVQGDGTHVDVLREAGIEGADLLIASTDDDETNIVVCGTASTVSDAFSIARVKSRRFLETWRAAEGAFGIDFMVCTDLLSAQSIVQVIGLPAARDVDTFADGLVRMAEFEVPADSPVADVTVREADHFEDLTFAAVVRDGAVSIPGGETVIRAGDDLVVIGTPESVRAFAADIAPRAEGPDDVVIFGGTEIAYETARLLTEQEFHPRLVVADPQRARELAELLPEVTVLEHDATDASFLEEEHVGEADVVLAALEYEEQNLLAGLLAKRLGADRAIAVVETGEYVSLFEAVGIDVAINPREATAEDITRFTRERETENVALIAGDRAEVLEITVDEESVLAGRPIRESAAELPEGVVLGAITRNGRFVRPRGDTVVAVGDHVVVLARHDVIETTIGAV